MCLLNNTFLDKAKTRLNRTDIISILSVIFEKIIIFGLIKDEINVLIRKINNVASLI